MRPSNLKTNTDLLWSHLSAADLKLDISGIRHPFRDGHGHGVPLGSPPKVLARR